MVADKLTTADIAAQLERAGLRPEDWDLAVIVAKANAWVASNLDELNDPDVATWSVALQAAHYAEFGKLAAVDFFEQCVVEAGPDTAPWQELAARADDGDFATWPPVWQAPKLSGATQE